MELQPGQTVRVRPLPHWYECLWFPKQEEITGMVEKVYKNGKVDVAVDQLPKIKHQHGRRTLSFKRAEILEAK